MRGGGCIKRRRVAVRNWINKISGKTLKLLYQKSPKPVLYKKGDFSCL